jgi:hypothetical protein
MAKHHMASFRRFLNGRTHWQNFITLSNLQPLFLAFCEREKEYCVNLILKHSENSNENVRAENRRTLNIKTTVMKRIFVWGIALWCLASCRKTPSLDQLTNKFVVITNRDSKANFTTYDTYHISDTVAFISNSPGADSIIVGANALQLVNAVKTNMNARGYQFVARTANPHLGLRLVAIKQVEAGVVYPPGWWWGYWGYPGWCYYGCYPPYYPYPVAYKYNVGDLIIEMLDVKNAGGNHNLKAIWVSDVGGVLSSTTQTNFNMAVDGINQAFMQSPYITAN